MTARWRNDYYRDAESGLVDRIEITPIDDLQPHDHTLLCACSPAARLENGVLIVVHKAHDGRELVEEHGVQ